MGTAVVANHPHSALVSYPLSSGELSLKSCFCLSSLLTRLSTKKGEDEKLNSHIDSTQTRSIANPNPPWHWGRMGGEGGAPEKATAAVSSMWPLLLEAIEDFIYNMAL